MSNTVLTTVQHIPTWVFGLFFGLLAFGVAQSFPRSLSLRRSAVLPILLVSLSLAGVLSSFGQVPAALLAWALGLAGTVAALHGRMDTTGVRFSADTQRFQVPGSWLPLALMMGLFAIKFGVGMTLALQPGLRSSVVFALVISTAYGVFSGAFLGRAMALWALARQALLQRA